MDILHKILLCSWETIKALSFISFQSALQPFRHQSVAHLSKSDLRSAWSWLWSLTFMNTVGGNTMYNKVCLYASSMFYSSYVKREPAPCFSNKKIMPFCNASYCWEGSCDSFGRLDVLRSLYIILILPLLAFSFLWPLSTLTLRLASPLGGVRFSYTYMHFFSWASSPPHISSGIQEQALYRNIITVESFPFCLYLLPCTVRVWIFH